MLEWLKLVPWSSWATFVPLVPAVVFGQSYAARDHDARQAVQVTERLKVEVHELRQQNTRLTTARVETEKRAKKLEQEVTAVRASMAQQAASSGASRPPAPSIGGSWGGSSARDREEAERSSRERESRERESLRAHQACEAGKKACEANCEGFSSEGFFSPRSNCRSKCWSINCPY